MPYHVNHYTGVVRHFNNYLTGKRDNVVSLLSVVFHFTQGIDRGHVLPVVFVEDHPSNWFAGFNLKHFVDIHGFTLYR